MALQRLHEKSGPLQVIALLETCTNTRRQQLLESLTVENPALAALVRTKILTLPHIASWTSVELRKLSSELDHTLRQRLFQTLENTNQHSKLKEIGVPPNTKIKVSPSELCEEMDVLIVLKAREMERIGTLEMRNFDPAKSVFDHISRNGDWSQSKPA